MQTHQGGGGGASNQKERLASDRHHGKGMTKRGRYVGEKLT